MVDRTRTITSLTLDPAVVARCDMLARHIGWSRSATVNRLLDRFAPPLDDNLPPAADDRPPLYAIIAPEPDEEARA
jgi:hypothetical protein